MIITKKKVKRRKYIEVDDVIDIISSRKVAEKIDKDSLWIKLNRKCVITGKKFKEGDSVSLIMYYEQGKKLSGGALTEAL